MTPSPLSQQRTTLVIDPTSERAWLGQWSRKGRFLWRTTLKSSGPGAFNFWPPLLKQKTTLHRKPPDRILVFTGPGPFSATRAAVNIANALGYAWNVPVVGVHGPANLTAVKQLLCELDQTFVPPRFEIAHRALPYHPKPVQLGRRKKRA